MMNFKIPAGQNGVTQQHCSSTKEYPSRAFSFTTFQTCLGIIWLHNHGVEKSRKLIAKALSEIKLMDFFFLTTRYPNRNGAGFHV